MTRSIWATLIGLTLLAAWVLHPQPSAPAGHPEETEAAIYADMRQVLTRDDILPVYQPRFVTAQAARIRDDELVLGVTIRGQTKAYDVSTLNAREIVVDYLAGTPILVTW